MAPINFDAAIAKFQDPKTQPELKKAYLEVIQERDLGYWKSEVAVKRYRERTMNGAVDSSDSSCDEEGQLKPSRVPKRKRGDNDSGTPRSPKYPHAIEVDEPVDDDESHLFKKEPGLASPRASEWPTHATGNAVDEIKASRTKRQKTSLSTKGATPSKTIEPEPPQKIS